MLPVKRSTPQGVDVGLGIVVGVCVMVEVWVGVQLGQGVAVVVGDGMGQFSAVQWRARPGVRLLVKQEYWV